MHVVTLRSPGAHFRVLDQRITLQDEDALEVIGNGPGCREPAHPGTDHDRLPSDCARHPVPLPFVREFDEDSPRSDEKSSTEWAKLRARRGGRRATNEAWLPK